jgi:dihydroxyacetone kinase
LATLRERQDELGKLDAFAGDGDHGVGMVRGAENALAAAIELAAQGAGVQTLLVGAGAQWAEQAGGTSGALWGSIFAAAGRVLGDTDAVDAAAQTRAARAALTAVLALGKAKPGDKTMVDAAAPFIETLEREVGAGTAIAQAWRSAADAALRAAEATAPMRPAIGRARPLADKSVGHADPGATSFAYVMDVIADQIAAAGLASE